jgi:hypothetical protein
MILFRKFGALNLSTQSNHTNIILVTDKVKASVGKLGLWVRKQERKARIFSYLKEFVEESIVETSDTRINQLVNLYSRFSYNLPKAISDKANAPRTHSMLIRPKIKTFFLKKDSILILYLLNRKVAGSIPDEVIF